MPSRFRVFRWRPLGNVPQSKEGAVLFENGLHDLVVHEANGRQIQADNEGYFKIRGIGTKRFKDDCAKPFNEEPNTF